MVRLLIVQFILFNLLLTRLLYSQVNCNDTSVYDDQPIRMVGENVSLISESSYYDAELLKKTKLDDGYGYNFKLSISDSCFAYAFIVSINEKIENNLDNIIKLEVGKNYQIKLIDYFELRLPLGIEYKHIYDVLLGSNKVSILNAANGNSFSKIFVSPNIIDTYYFNPLSNLEEPNFKLSIDINKVIFDFIRLVTFSNQSDSLKYLINKFQLKKSLTRYYSNVIGVHPSKSYNSFEKMKELPKRHPNKKIINISKFRSFDYLFEKMLNEYYKLPIIDSVSLLKGFTLKDISIKPIYYYNGIITVQVKWKLTNSNQYIAIFSLKNYDGNYKIFRFNQPADFYFTKF